MKRYRITTADRRNYESLISDYKKIGCKAKELTEHITILKDKTSFITLIYMEV